MDEGHVRGAAKMMDSREKLEEDCEKLIGNIQKRIFSGRDAGALRYQLNELLDRQAAMTERYWREQVDALAAKGDQLAEANVGLRALADRLEAERDLADRDVRMLADVADGLNKRVDELTAERDALQAKLDALKAHGVTVSEPFCGGYEVHNERKRQVDDLRAELAKRDKGIARLKRRRDELESALEIDSRIRASQDAAIEEIARQRDEARHDLEQAEATCMGQRREIEELRERLRRPARAEDGLIDGSGRGNADGLEPLRRLAREMESRFGSDVPMAEYEKLERDLRECDNQRIEYRNQRDWYADECARLERLNAELREKLSDAIGHAWAIVQSQDLSAVDMEGEVADR